MAKHRTHSIEFKRQVVQEFLGGESPHALARRHGISRNLIKIWVAKYETGGLDSDAAAAFDDQWLGYFPGTEWDNSYTKSALLQWFGEVASQNGVPPRTQMGDGVLAIPQVRSLSPLVLGRPPHRSLKCPAVRAN
jgi:hypothetical protein